MVSVLAQLRIGGMLGVMAGVVVWLFIGIPVAEVVISPLVSSPEALTKSTAELWLLNFVGKALALGVCVSVGAGAGRTWIPW